MGLVLSGGALELLCKGFAADGFSRGVVPLILTEEVEKAFNLL